jgi:hypothetical protein
MARMCSLAAYVLVSGFLAAGLSGLVACQMPGPWAFRVWVGLTIALGGSAGVLRGRFTRGRGRRRGQVSATPMGGPQKRAKPSGPIRGLWAYSAICGSSSVLAGGLVSLLIPGTVWGVASWVVVSFVLCTCSAWFADRFVNH